MLNRANNYVTSEEDTRALQFAYLSLFGLKEPVFTEHHLLLCEEKTLLLLRSDATKLEQKIKPLILHESTRGLASDGNAIFQVSFEVGARTKPAFFSIVMLC